MFKPIVVLLLILGVGIVIGASEPRDERPVLAAGGATSASAPSAMKSLIQRLEAGGSALAAAADTAVTGAEAEAMAILLARGAPFLTEWIGRARADALARGTEPIPADIRSQLRKFYPDPLLKTVRWRVGLSADGSLPARLFEAYGRALTLDDVIIFRDDATARDPVIWAHEVAHVQQYQRWGVEGFARRYVANYREVEREAWATTGEWAKHQGDAAKP